MPHHDRSKLRRLLLLRAGKFDVNRRTDKRQAVLDAAMDELMAHGLSGASMEAIATRAAVSKRTLYKYFPSIEAVFNDMTERALAQVEPLGQLRYDERRALPEQLRQIAHAEMQLICDPQFIRLSRILMSEALRSAEQSTRLLARSQEKELGLYRWFAQVHAANALGDLAPEVAAETFVGLLKSGSYWRSVIGWQAPPDEAQQQATIDEACRTLLARIADNADR